MAFNIALAALAALSQLGNAFMGWKVTGKTLSSRQQKIYDALFIIIGVVGIVAVGLIAYRSSRQERAHFAFQIENAYTGTSKSAGKVIPYSWFVINEPLAFSVYQTNVGSGSAYNVDVHTHAFLRTRRGNQQSETGNGRVLFLATISNAHNWNNGER